MSLPTGGIVGGGVPEPVTRDLIGCQPEGLLFGCARFYRAAVKAPIPMVNKGPQFDGVLHPGLLRPRNNPAVVTRVTGRNP